jgi:hypothetical protein
MVTTLQLWSENETCFTKRIDVNLVIRFQTLSLSFISPNGWLMNQSLWALRNVAASLIRRNSESNSDNEKQEEMETQNIVYNKWHKRLFLYDSCVNKSRTIRQPR